MFARLRARRSTYAISQPEMAKVVPHLHTTVTKDGKTYWHIHLKEGPSGLEMLVPKTGQTLPLAQFAMPAG